MALRLCLINTGNNYIQMYFNEEEEIDTYEHIDPQLIYIYKNIPTLKMSDTFNEQFCVGCECIDLCNAQSNCQCLLRSGAIYNIPSDLHNLDNYEITIQDPNHPLYECNANCKCQEICQNRLVQFGPRKGLLIRECKSSSGKKKGLGLITTTHIKKGNFICEYAGEVITKDEALERHIFNEEHNLMNFIICVNEEFGDRFISTFIDPSKFGNIGRYINHSCEPNCDLFIFRINNLIPKVCIFARNDISAGSELTFDYGITKGTHTIQGQKLVECLCDSKFCKGSMPFHTYF